jgi:hypothetical protein
MTNVVYLILKSDIHNDMVVKALAMASASPWIWLALST